MQAHRPMRSQNPVRLRAWAMVFLTGALLALTSLAHQVFAQQESSDTAVVLTVEGLSAPRPWITSPGAYAGRNPRVLVW